MMLRATPTAEVVKLDFSQTYKFRRSGNRDFFLRIVAQGKELITLILRDLFYFYYKISIIKNVCPFLYINKKMNKIFYSTINKVRINIKYVSINKVRISIS